ncbi:MULTISPECIES: xanthine dehydrogenase family protein subunit M [Micromonospora]|uniref:FAD-binding molybdopterin dehydrogenase n=1 Tax=Micromonospora sicca TaxID=2202420 RepID=A0A317DMF4_9ACTN|nr:MULTISPECIES: xanthine dehydrogenase family protein subunit M [unclassified Micromonospora]MBM0228439.1 xanthine dehydrogenase family protein subunit M [Micromonospora sp. ATA51]PWR14135.1 FAD-binding molybdopterin dehydrogenase [Micromonospora sp. 4G51]
MRPISYSRVADVGTAIGTVSADPESAFLAGGTTQVDLMRIYVEQPRRLVDINDLPLTRVEELPDGGLRLGGLARMSDVAEEPAVVRRYPMVAEALLMGASPQLRNMATVAGNLMQRVRCSYFRDVAAGCNKRAPGTGCSALDGINRGHAVLGTSECCIATHPSDVAVALVALDAVVQTEGPAGRRSIPIDDFFLLPGQTPEREHPLTHGELVTGIDLPPLPVAATSRYVKIRDRESYEFALAAVAVAMSVAGGRITEIRLALGGVATKPWRARAAERVLDGAPADTDSFTRAAEAELASAVPHGMNAFKIELTRRTMVRALAEMAQREGTA